MLKSIFCFNVFIIALIVGSYYDQKITISNNESDIIQVRRFELKHVCKDTVLFNGVKCTVLSSQF